MSKIYFIKDIQKEGIIFTDGEPYTVGELTPIQEDITIDEKQRITTDSEYMSYITTKVTAYQMRSLPTHIDTGAQISPDIPDSQGISYTYWFTPNVTFEEFNTWGIGNHTIPITFYYKFVGNYTDKYTYLTAPNTPYPNQDTELPSYTIERTANYNLNIIEYVDPGEPPEPPAP